MEQHEFSKKYPPKNRIDTGLELLQIQLEDAGGVHLTDPNGAAVMGYTRKLPVLQPKFPSNLSGKPGYFYRNSEGVQVALTKDELLRFLRHDLKPAEVLKLHELFGVFFETHDDFYDEDTGQALQPMDN